MNFLIDIYQGSLNFSDLEQGRVEHHSHNLIVYLYPPSNRVKKSLPKPLFSPIQLCKTQHFYFVLYLSSQRENPNIKFWKFICNFDEEKTYYVANAINLVKNSLNLVFRCNILMSLEIKNKEKSGLFKSRFKIRTYVYCQGGLSAREHFHFYYFLLINVMPCQANIFF